MSSIQIAGDTSGSITLQAPATAGSTTLTLPTTNGTVLTSASSIATSQLSGTVGTANLGSGTASSSTYLRGDSTWATISGGGQYQAQLFTTPGTFTTPANCTSVKVLVVGGGGCGTSAGNGGQPSGNSSSFSTLISATGGGGSPGGPTGSSGSNGSGTVSTGTSLFTSSAGNLNYSQKSFMQGVLVGGQGIQNTPTSSGIAYTINGGQAAGGSGAPTAPNYTVGGAGGMALGICPVSANTPYPITVGSGGGSAGQYPGIGGVVYVEFVG